MERFFAAAQNDICSGISTLVILRPQPKDLFPRSPSSDPLGWQSAVRQHRAAPNIPAVTPNGPVLACPQIISVASLNGDLLINALNE
jgi:hypothetical protein